VKSISARKRQGSVVDASDLPPELLQGRRRKTGAADAASKPPPDVQDAIVALDKQMVRQALALSEGDRKKAAELLKIDIGALEKLINDEGP
jgi:transcriptional regulator with PAS, ATPase and Fis domain